ncbi:MAG: hypothetical protein BECKG1743E_GA0114224_110701 [Candidatus Kentron sp. G]|nr:MAG: hypothetical protein BECKG1743E_GA0114224_110701 [Candidatus Kentron sp. G]
MLVLLPSFLRCNDSYIVHYTPVCARIRTRVLAISIKEYTNLLVFIVQLLTLQ